MWISFKLLLSIVSIIEELTYKLELLINSKTQNLWNEFKQLRNKFRDLPKNNEYDNLNEEILNLKKRIDQQDEDMSNQK